MCCLRGFSAGAGSSGGRRPQARRHPAVVGGLKRKGMLLATVFTFGVFQPLRHCALSNLSLSPIWVNARPMARRT